MFANYDADSDEALFWLLVICASITAIIAFSALFPGRDGEWNDMAGSHYILAAHKKYILISIAKIIKDNDPVYWT